MLTVIFILYSVFSLISGDDVGCLGSSSGGNSAVGCTQRGCCEWDNHITSSGLCDGDNEVCCYSSITCSNPGGGTGGSGSDTCTSSVSGSGDQGVGCTQRGCCAFDNHITSSDLCSGANEVCCYSEITCSDPGGGSGSESCTSSVSGSGDQGVGCVDLGCCDFDYHVTNSALCPEAGQVCCYSRDMCSGNGNGNCANVHLVTKSEWGAAPASCSRMSLPVPYLFIHHTVSADCFTQSACEREMRNIQSFHFSIGNCDIAYNYLVGGDGSVYEGRGWPVSGAHTFGYNFDSVAISYIGNFNNQMPTPAALQAGKDMVHCAEIDGIVTGSYELFGHRDSCATDCPGHQLYADIQTWPQYSFRSIPSFC